MALGYTPPVRRMRLFLGVAAGTAALGVTGSEAGASGVRNYPVAVHTAVVAFANQSDKIESGPIREGEKYLVTVPKMSLACADPQSATPIGASITQMGTHLQAAVLQIERYELPLYKLAKQVKAKASRKNYVRRLDSVGKELDGQLAVAKWQIHLGQAVSADNCSGVAKGGAKASSLKAGGESLTNDLGLLTFMTST